MKRQKWLKISLMGGLLICAKVSAEQQHLPILQYHHVGEKTPFSTSVTPDELQAQMNYLSDAGFEVVDLKSSLEILRQGGSLSDKAVAITFDDAYRDIYLQGFPILKEKGFPFTIFINTQPVMQKNRNFLTWEQMREMEAAGAVMANHTIAHPYMLRKDPDETLIDWEVRMRHEIDEVERLLIANLGHSPNMLAYPYGESSHQIRSWLDATGMIGFGQQSGVVHMNSDFTNLPRFPASGPYAKLDTLKAKLNALPMPLENVADADDFAFDEPVAMTLTFKEKNYRFKDLACYVSGQGKAILEWDSAYQVRVITETPFPYGRGRINCTMPTQSGRQFYWYSNVWIKPRSDQGYVIDEKQKN